MGNRPFILRFDFKSAIYYSVLWRSREFVHFTYDGFNCFIYAPQQSDDGKQSAANAGDEGDDLHHACDAFGVPQQFRIGAELLLPAGEPDNFWSDVFD